MNVKNKKPTFATFLLSIFMLVFTTSLFFPVSRAVALQCFNFDGTRLVECQDIGKSLRPNRCYKEVRGGPNGTLLDYQETACGTSVDCADSQELNSKNCGIIRYLTIFINALSAIVGIVVVIMIVVGGIQYSAARDNPQAVQAAKSRITNAIIALVVYLFFYGFLNYLIPGGLF